MSAPTSAPQPPQPATVVPETRLAGVLAPLVADATITSEQADAVYRGFAASADAPIEQTNGPLGPRIGAALAILGLGLLGSAVLLSSQFIGDNSPYGSVGTFNRAGLATALSLVGVIVVGGLAAWLGAPRRHWPPVGPLAVVTAASTTLLLFGVAVVLTLEGSGEGYVVATGAVLLVGGVAGYAALRLAPFVVPVIGGGVVLVTEATDHIGSNAGSHGHLLLSGVVLAAFGVLVAIAGWWTPHRQLAGVLGCLVAIVSMEEVILENGFTGAFSLGSQGIEISYRSDTITALIVGLAVCLGLAVAYAATRSGGFATLSLIGAVVLPASAGMFITQKHPLQVAAVFAAIGGVLAMLGLAAAWRASRQALADEA